MKIYSSIKAIVALGWVLPCATAYGQSAAELVISGSLKPAACNVSFNKNAVDWGKVAHTQLRDRGTATIDLTATLTVQCDSPAPVSLSIMDNRSDSAIALQDVDASVFPSLSSHPILRAIYGLGLAGNSNVKIGAYEVAIRLNGVRIDGVPLGPNRAALLHKQNSNLSWEALTGYNNLAFPFMPAFNFSFAKTGTAPQAIGRADLALEFRGVVAPREVFSAADEVKLDGSLTVNLSYL